MKLHSFKTVFSFLLIWFYTFVSSQYTIPEKPVILYPVFDEVGLLSQQEKDMLNKKLIKFADSTSTEIEVVIIRSTRGEDINFLATMFGEKWKIGKKGLDNGLIFLIATEDRTMSIQPGRAIEQYLTASIAGQILDYIVTPNFRNGLWYEGINGGTSAIMEAVQGKFKPLTVTAPSDNGNAFKVLIIALIIFIIFAIIFGNKDCGNNDNNDNDDDVIITRRGHQNYPGGFFPFPGGFGGRSPRGGGGGFGGFGGGGSFGGGGASGGW